MLISSLPNAPHLALIQWALSLFQIHFQSNKCVVSACHVCLSHLWRYWWLKLKSLAEKEEWEELEKFSRTKKSPIGYLVRTKRFMVSIPLLCNGNVSNRKQNCCSYVLFSLLWKFAWRATTSTKPRNMFPGLRQNRRFGLIWPSGKQDWEESARWRLISLLMSSSCLFLVIWRELLMLRLNAGTIRRLGSSSPDAPPLIAFWLIGWTEPEAALLKNNSDAFAQPKHHLSWLCEHFPNVGCKKVIVTSCLRSNVTEVSATVRRTSTRQPDPQRLCEILQRLYKRTWSQLVKTKQPINSWV